MGFFSSEDVVMVSSSSVKLVDKYPDLMAEAVVFAVTNSGSIPDNILAAYRNNFSSQVDNLIRYAKRSPNGYYFGMPSGTLNGYSIDYGTLRNTIADIEEVTPNEVTISEARLGKLDPQTWADNYMINRFPTWSPDNRQLPTELIKINDKWYHYYSIEVMKTYNYSTNEYYISNVKIQFAHNTGTIRCSEDSNGFQTDCYPVMYYHYISIGFPQGDKWYQVYYKIPNKEGTQLFLYDTVTKVYPDLKEPTISNTSAFYPVIPVKRQFRYVSTYNDKMSASVKKALNYLDFSLNDFEKTIKDSPNAADLSDAFVNFRIPLFTQEQKSIEYLYKFFQYVKVGLPTIQNSIGHINTNAGKSFINVKEDLMDYTIYFSGVVVTTMEGTIGEVGTYSNLTEMGSAAYPNPDYEPTEDGLGYNNQEFLYTPYTQVKKQVAPNEISVITVSELDGYSIVTFEGDKFTAKTHPDIPLMEFIMDSFDTLEKSDILMDAAHITIYAAKEEHVKWYKSSFFSFIFKIAAIVIAIFTFNPALVGYAMALQVVATGLAIITALSPELGAQLGILGTVLAIATLTIGGFSGVLNQLTSSVMNFAETLMKAINAISEYVVKGIQGDMEELTSDYNDFMEEYEIRLDEVNEAQKILDDMEDDNYYNPLWSVGEDANEDSIFDVNESPESFYNRTIHTGNPGVRTLNEPSSFVSNMLRLPEFNYDDMIPAYRNPDVEFL